MVAAAVQPYRRWRRAGTSAVRPDESRTKDGGGLVHGNPLYHWIALGIASVLLLPLSTAILIYRRSAGVHRETSALAIHEAQALRR
jgi:hypothetical protein